MTEPLLYGGAGERKETSEDLAPQTFREQTLQFRAVRLVTLLSYHTGVKAGRSIFLGMFDQNGAPVIRITCKEKMERAKAQNVCCSS